MVGRLFVLAEGGPLGVEEKEERNILTVTASGQLDMAISQNLLPVHSFLR